MRIRNMRMKGSWAEVLDAARETVGKEALNREPSDKWKKKILLAEHSPIRRIFFSWEWVDLPYDISTHFVRHKYGIEHWVKSQRTDRTGVDRSKLSQKAPVNHMAEGSVQALINISRKRFCNKADAETQEAWNLVFGEIRKIDPIIASVMVPECVYRGFCPEMASCGDLFHGFDLGAYRKV